jgi:UDP-glucose 4-epimerase
MDLASQLRAESGWKSVSQAGSDVHSSSEPNPKSEIRNPKARVLVTGGAGFIGSHTVEAFLARGWEVTALDNLSTGKRQNLAQAPVARLVVGDIEDRDLVFDLIRPGAFDAVVHLAAVASVVRSVEDPIATHRANVDGTLHVLEAARQAGVRRVALASSAAVYGEVAECPVTEDAPKCPASPYGLHKWFDEQYARLYAGMFGLETVCLRYFNVYGPRQDPGSPYSGVISVFADRLARRQPVRIHGDGGQTRDFIYVKDLAAANVAAVETPLQGCHALNVGTGRQTTIRALYDQVAAITGVDTPPLFGEARPGDIRHSCARADRLREVLGIVATKPLCEGLRETVGG